MRFQLKTLATTVLLTVSCVNAQFSYSDDNGLDLFARDEYSSLHSRDLLDIRDDDLLARDELLRRGELFLGPGEPLGGFSVLETRTTACGNQGKIGRPKYDPNCLPSNSKGYKSAHNCQGKSYLCVIGGKATCYVRPSHPLLFYSLELVPS